jgi:chromosome segregation ATPase
MSSTAPAARATDMTEGLRQELARETARRTDNEILIRELVTSNYDLNKRNGELEKQNTELNRKNDEFVSSIEAANKSNNNLTTQLTAVKTQLEQERMRRMAVESRLNLIYNTTQSVL